LKGALIEEVKVGGVWMWMWIWQMWLDRSLLSSSCRWVSAFQHFTCNGCTLGLVEEEEEEEEIWMMEVPPFVVEA